MTAPYIQPKDLTVQNPPTDTAQAPPPAKPPPATVPTNPIGPIKGDMLISPPTDKSSPGAT